MEESMKVIRQVLAIRNLQKQRPFQFYLACKEGEWTGMVYLPDDTIVELVKTDNVYSTLSRLADKLWETMQSHSILDAILKEA